MPKRIHVLFSGQVQGVGFRYTAQSLADQLNLTGWTKNLPDGRVEILAEGGQENLQKFLEKINQNFDGYIADHQIDWQKATGEFKEFGIRF